MKNFLPLFLFITFSGYSKEPINNRFKIGVGLGLNVSYLDRFGPYQDDLGYFDRYFLVGQNISASFSCKIASILELQTGFGIARHGGAFRYEAGTVTNQPSASNGNRQTTSKVYYKDKYKMDFFEIPLLVKILILPNKSISPYLLGGFSYGILLRSVNRYNFDDIRVMKKDNIKDVTTSNSINFIYGAGVDFLRDERVSFGAQLRSSNSITKVFKHDQLEYAFPDENDAENEYVSVYPMETFYHTISALVQLNYSF